MTEYYARPSFKLSAAPTSTKVLLTLFLLSVLLGYGVAITNQYVRSTFSTDAVVTYYQGSEEELVFPKPFREMLSISHVHLFGMPILFFILCHVFDLTSIRQTVKSGVFIASFLAIFLQIGSPLLVRYGSSGFAGLIPASYTLLTLVVLVLVVVPLKEMWSRDMK